MCCIGFRLLFVELWWRSQKHGCMRGGKAANQGNRCKVTYSCCTCTNCGKTPKATRTLQWRRCRSGKTAVVQHRRFGFTTAMTVEVVRKKNSDSNDFRCERISRTDGATHLHVFTFFSQSTHRKTQYQHATWYPSLSHQFSSLLLLLCSKARPIEKKKNCTIKPNKSTCPLRTFFRNNTIAFPLPVSVYRQPSPHTVVQRSTTHVDYCHPESRPHSSLSPSNHHQAKNLSRLYPVPSLHDINAMPPSPTNTTHYTTLHTVTGHWAWA